jgi:energy-converting hydrogenase Eha subunit B
MLEIISVLLEIIPLALVAAISPTSFALVIVLLSLSKRPKTSGTGFLLGSFLVILAAAFLGILAAEGAFLLSRAEPTPLKSVIDLLLGIIVLFYGFKILLMKNAWFEEKEIELPTSNKSPTSEFLSSMFLAMGLFALNFITTALVFLGGSKIAAADLGWLGTLISLLVLIAISLSMVAIPVLIYFLTPQKADKILYKLNKWIKKNGHYLTAILVIIIGLYFIYNGLNGLNWI